MRLTRRHFLRSGLTIAGAAAIVPSLVRSAFAEPAQPGVSPYGPLRPPDANGVMLPDGFTSRIVAFAGLPVLPGVWPWHTFPDGGATFATGDGGWIYVSNSEVPNRLGGVGAIRFSPDASVVRAYPILLATSSNCAGGATPWGTWLSCEETDSGITWECDPTGEAPAVARPALGVFKHEAAAVDPVRRHVYLTEDTGNGRFYRFVPDAYPDLGAGTLEVAQVLEDGAVVWHTVPDPSAASGPTRTQVAASTRFNGGEGCFYDAGIVYFTTKGDDRVWAYDAAASRIEVLYDARALADPPLTGVDNVLVSSRSGDVFVAEDGGDLDIAMITAERAATRLLKVTGVAHTGSELAGPAFDPSGTRMYFSSQRGYGRGVTFEVTGPFRTTP